MVSPFFALLSLLPAAFAAPSPDLPTTSVSSREPTGEINPIVGGAVLQDDTPLLSALGTLKVPDLKIPENHAPDENWWNVNSFITLDYLGCGPVPTYLTAGLWLDHYNGRPSWILRYSFSDFFGTWVEDVPVNPGDVLRFNVSVGTNSVHGYLDATEGDMTVENLTQGWVDYNRPSNTLTPLCGRSVGWYVERSDPRKIEFFDPLPDFDVIRWTDVYAVNTAGEKISPKSATIYDLDDGFTATKTIVTDDTISIYYDGLSK